MSIIDRLYNPYYLAKRYANARDGSRVATKDILVDMGWKATGGLTLAPLIYLLTRGHDEVNLNNKRQQEDIKEYLGSRYVAIPSEKEPDVTEELMKEHKEAQEEEEPSAWDVFLPKTRGMGFAIPLSTAALVSALFLGTTNLSKKRSRKLVEAEKGKQQELNKEIGRLVERRYRESRGLDKVSQEDGESSGWFSSILNYFQNVAPLRRGYNALTGMATVGLLSGLIAGWAKGRSMNESIITDKAVRQALEANKVVSAIPKVIVPNTYSQFLESSAQRSPRQKRVPVQDIV